MGKKDIINKHVLKQLTAEITNLLLGLDIDANGIELLETEQQRIAVQPTPIASQASWIL